MSPMQPSRDPSRKSFLIFLTVAITSLFLVMIRQFLVSVLLAAVFAGMAHPLYEAFLRRWGGRRRWASASTIAVISLVVGIPLLALLGLVASQAVEVSQAAGPWIEKQIGQVGELDERIQGIAVLERFPRLRSMLPTGEEIVAKVGEVASATGTFLVGSLGDLTRGTFGFFLQLFIVSYAMFYFLVDGRVILDRILCYAPLSSVDEERLLERFVSVTRATLKGSLLIGILQGVLAGFAFALSGIRGAAFWGTITAVVSIIPAIGAAIIWFPMVIYLLVTGHTGAGIGLLAWSALVVSTIDNFLRPRLVGRDTRMSDLLILLSTLGGLALFGPVGFIVGPIVAALFVTVWHIYGDALSHPWGHAPPPNGLVPLEEGESSVASSTGRPSFTLPTDGPRLDSLRTSRGGLPKPWSRDDARP